VGGHRGAISFITGVAGLFALIHQANKWYAASGDPPYFVNFDLYGDSSDSGDRFVKTETYSRNGRLLKHSIWNYIGRRLVKIEYYNSIDEKERNAASIYNGHTLYSYNYWGRLAKEQEYGSDGEKGFYWLYSYNNQGQLVKEKLWEPIGDGEKVWYRLYSYNDQGRLAKEQLYGAHDEKGNYYLYTVEDPFASKCLADDLAACEEVMK